MSASVSAASIPPAGTMRRPALNPWIVALAVVVPTFMEVLDTTIANVALRYIAGGLSAAVTDSEWVVTSYLAANAIILPISGWLAANIGRRRYFLLSIAVFTISSVFCGMATSLNQLILFRVVQGLAADRKLKPLIRQRTALAANSSNYFSTLPLQNPTF